MLNASGLSFGTVLVAVLLAAGCGGGHDSSEHLPGSWVQRGGDGTVRATFTRGEDENTFVLDEEGTRTTGTWTADDRTLSLVFEAQGTPVNFASTYYADADVLALLAFLPAEGEDPDGVIGTWVTRLVVNADTSALDREIEIDLDADGVATSTIVEIRDGDSSTITDETAYEQPEPGVVEIGAPIGLTLRLIDDRALVIEDNLFDRDDAAATALR